MIECSTHLPQAIVIFELHRSCFPTISSYQETRRILYVPNFVQISRSPLDDLFEKSIFLNLFLILDHIIINLWLCSYYNKVNTFFTFLDAVILSVIAFLNHHSLR